MSRPTIAEQREKAVNRLAERKQGGTVKEAKKLMNSYYRLVGLCDRLLWLQNEEATCNLESTREAEKRRDKWNDRLNRQFEKYNAELIYFGYFPTICKLGTTQDLYLAYFYN